MLASYGALLVGLGVLSLCLHALAGRGHAGLRLRCARALLGGLALAILATALVRPGPVVEELAPRWSGAWQSPMPASVEPGPSGGSPSPAAPERTMAPIELVAWMLAIAVGLRGLFVARSYFELFALHRTSVLRRVQGRLELRTAPGLTAPFAYTCLGSGLAVRRVIMLDEASWANVAIRRIAVAHEGQHHRQGDALFAHVLAVVGVVAWPNPLCWRLSSAFEALEEHACDEAVLRRGQFTVRAYGRCLLAAAARGFHIGESLPGTALRAMARRQSLLRTRIEYMRHSSTITRTTPITLATALGMTLVAGAVWAGKAQLSTSAPVSEATLGQFFSHQSGSIEIPDRPEIRAELRTILNDPAKRARLRAAVVAAEDFRDMIDGHLLRMQLPSQLRAVPIVESRYRPGASQPGKAPELDVAFTVGLWQFIPSTARGYGLRVDAELDQRRTPELETPAALRYLSDLYAEFGDWGLSFAGYYQGAHNVRAAIEAGGTRDVWALMGRGLLKKYPLKIMTAMLILDSPELLD